MKLAHFTTLAAAGASLALFAVPGFAQDGAPPPPPPPDAPAPPAGGPALATPSVSGGPAAPAPRNADRMEQFRQRLNERIKTELQASDEEWAVIQPLLESVQTKLQANMQNRFSGIGLGGPPRPRPEDQAGGGNGNPNRPDRRERPGSEAVTSLRTTLENESASNTEIKEKLEALRASRKKSEDDLAQARADLKKVLNLRQEATLVMMGMLD